jgi:lipoprotein-anchoring transpeptidase ErfK/SrfK
LGEHLISSVAFQAAAGGARRGALVILAALLLSSTNLPAQAQWRQASPWGWGQPAYYPPGYQSYPGGYQQRDVAPRPDAPAPAAKKPVAKKPTPKDTDKVERAAAPKGPLHIVVSIASQKVKIYDGDTVIAEAPVSTGTATHPTPTGVFSVIQKNRFHRSNLYSDAPMPFMQRLTWSGVALHEGKLPGYPASHGCIRLPAAFAQKLWGMTKLGVRVIVAPSDVTPFELSHPALFARKLQPVDNQVAQLRPSIVDDRRDQVIPVTDNGRDQLIPIKDTAPDPVRTADAATTATDAAQEGEPLLWKVKPLKADSAESSKAPALRAGPVSVFVSRKEGRLFVRKGFATVFDVPVTIRDPQAAIGTHVVTAIANAESGPAMRWLAITLPGEAGDKRAEQPVQNVKLASREVRGKGVAIPAQTQAARAAQQALDRIEIPPEAIDRISDMLAPGASLIISDHGRGDETGVETDFVILTR